MPQLETSLFESLRQIHADYAAALPSRFRRVRTRLYGSGDAHYWDRFRFNEMREYARDMERNDCVVKALLDRAVENVIQDKGFNYEPQTGDTGLDVDLRARFDDWAEDEEQCDLMGELTFWEQEKLVYRQQLLDGDLFTLPTSAGSLQHLEADRCQSAMEKWAVSIHGVVLDKDRRRQEYWFTDDARNYHMIRYADLTRIAARDSDGNKQVFHLVNPMRMTQTRGVTVLHPIFDVCGQFEDLQFAKLIQAQMVSMIGLFLTRQQGAQPSDMKLGTMDSQTLVDGNDQKIEGLSPGMIGRLPSGYDMKTLESKVPNSEFFPHVKLLLTLIGINLGMPLIEVLMDASETNFSGWRGAMNQAQMGFRCNQKWLRIRFHRQVVCWLIRRWLALPASMGGLGPAARRLGKGIFKHTWHVPGFPYVQPKDDMEADFGEISKGLSSSRRVLAKRGLDFTDVLRESIDDNSAAIEAAMDRAEAIKKRHPGQDLSWREVLNREAAAGLDKLLGMKDKGGAGAGEGIDGAGNDGQGPTNGKAAARLKALGA